MWSVVVHAMMILLLPCIVCQLAWCDFNLLCFIFPFFYSRLEAVTRPKVFCTPVKLILWMLALLLDCGAMVTARNFHGVFSCGFVLFHNARILWVVPCKVYVGTNMQMWMCVCTSWTIKPVWKTRKCNCEGKWLVNCTVKWTRSIHLCSNCHIRT